MLPPYFCHCWLIGYIFLQCLCLFFYVHVESWPKHTTLKIILLVNWGSNILTKWFDLLVPPVCLVMKCPPFLEISNLLQQIIIILLRFSVFSSRPLMSSLRMPCPCSIPAFLSIHALSHALTSHLIPLFCYSCGASVCVWIFSIYFPMMIRGILYLTLGNPTWVEGE